MVCWLPTLFLCLSAPGPPRPSNRLELSTRLSCKCGFSCSFSFDLAHLPWRLKRPAALISCVLRPPRPVGTSPRFALPLVNAKAAEKLPHDPQTFVVESRGQFPKARFSRRSGVNLPGTAKEGPGHAVPGQRDPVVG